MNLSDIGEFGFINRFKHIFDNLLKNGEYGIGDDCAVIPINSEENLIVTTDMLTEDIHFLRNDISAYELGYKSAAVNISDIAAMGGVPVCSFLSVAIPVDCDVEYLDNFMQGFYEISKKYNMALLGGDTTKSAKYLTINVTVIGKCKRGKEKLRSMAKEGDIICTTNYLGDSAGGLQIILNNLKDSKNDSIKYLLECHHKPEPRIPEGQFLAKYECVHAMMDISDGIASDLNHILEQSTYIDAIVSLNDIPISCALRDIGAKYNLDIVNLATCGGEDYELLFTVANNEEFLQLKENFFATFKKPLFIIGKIIKSESLTGEIHWFDNGTKINYNKNGFNHFKR